MDSRAPPQICRGRLLLGRCRQFSRQNPATLFQYISLFVKMDSDLVLFPCVVLGRSYTEELNESPGDPWTDSVSPEEPSAGKNFMFTTFLLH